MNYAELLGAAASGAKLFRLSWKSSANPIATFDCGGHTYALGADLARTPAEFRYQHVRRLMDAVERSFAVYEVLGDYVRGAQVHADSEQGAAIRLLRRFLEANRGLLWDIQEQPAEEGT